MEDIIKFLSEHGFVTFATALFEKIRLHIQSLFAASIQDVTDTCNDAKADIDQHHTAAVSHIDLYAPMECLTNAEYEAKQEAGTLEEDKMYFRFFNE